jgi:prophage antirepressor-like protein
MDLATTAKQFEGEGFAVSVITYKGVDYVAARDVGRALGYADDGSRLSQLISSDWAEDFIDGTDFVRLEGQDLADLKALGTDYVGSRARWFVLLTRSGADLVCMKTDKPVGRKLRRWIVDVVFPALRAGESVSLATHSPADLTPPRPRPQPDDRRLAAIEARERRLTAEVDSKIRRQKAEAIRGVVGLYGHTVDKAVSQSLMVRAAELEAGEPLHQLLPRETGRWYTPTEIAGLLSCTPQRVGLLITRAAIRDDARYARAVVNKAAGHDRTVTSYQYNEEGLEVIRAQHHAWAEGADAKVTTGAFGRASP